MLVKVPRYMTLGFMVKGRPWALAFFQYRVG
jgi:hypothetical protein